VDEGYLVAARIGEDHEGRDRELPSGAVVVHQRGILGRLQVSLFSRAWRQADRSDSGSPTGYDG